MTAPFDPATYPGARSEGPAVVHQGRVEPVAVTGSADTPVHADVAAPVLEPDCVRWCLAYGSNASPPRLVAKGLDERGALLLPAVVAGWRPAFEARRTRYGAVPLTLVPDRAAVTRTWVLGVHADDVARLDRSEGRVAGGAACDPGRVAHGEGDSEVVAPPGAYDLGAIGAVAVADRFLLEDALAYLPGPPARVQVVAGGWRTWPESDQAAAASHVAGSGPTQPAPRAVEPLAGPWPRTPLTDLPLLVYGTLQPGGRAWDRISDLVEVVGPAATAGRLHDNGHGWPAAVFGGSGIVRGTLVVARDHASGVELVRRADAYEAVPGLFIRTTVSVTTDQERRWAVAYAWNGHRRPGAPVPGGRWRPRPSP